MIQDQTQKIGQNVDQTVFNMSRVNIKDEVIEVPFYKNPLVSQNVASIECIPELENN